MFLRSSFEARDVSLKADATYVVSGFSRTFCSTILALMPLRKRVYGAGKLLVLVGALLVTYIVFTIGSMRFALRSREVQVPDLTNRTSGEATAIVNDLGLNLMVDDVKRVDLKIPAGRVLAQEPAVGSTARRQRTVRVWLSAGPRAATVPGVTGEIERLADARL